MEDVRRCEVAGLPLLAVNNAYMYSSGPDIVYAGDVSWWNRHRPYVPPYSLRFGMRSWRGLPGPGGVEVMERGPGEHFSLEWPVLGTGKNGGYQAINLAYLLGYRRVILLGYDMQFTWGRRHFHPDHPDRNPQESTMREWLRIFRKMAPAMEEAGLEVVNCTRETALNCFPLMSLEEALSGVVGRLDDQRCPRCNKLLYRGEVIRIQIKCPRCKHLVHHEVLHLRRRVKGARA
jgi:hypothetical protein